MKLISNSEILHEVQEFIYSNYECFHLNVEVQRNDKTYLQESEI